ncbi:hypothetical protein [Halegenticoccus soli]|uniref:hypothetical protein n=1 Tax=Halegenticoccus soli TaxID=1985678 RepID=UPI000C6E265A|nr:hypothetical protein [Halegenticoccus soli]
MNLFRKLGRQVEQFKTKAKAASRDRASYRCTECGARFSEQRERCPECGSGDVVSVTQQE